MDEQKFYFGLFLIFKLVVSYCNCQTTTLTPVDPDVVEGSDITFVCTVSSVVNYVNWRLPLNATSFLTNAMAAQNGACAISPPTSILSDTTKYSYTCTSTVYQVTVKNVQRSQHKDVWSCYPGVQLSGHATTIYVQVPVSSVSITPSSTTIDVRENTVEEFICQTSASRPDASVTWYKVESGGTPQLNQNITSSTTNDDFSVTTSTLKFVPSRQEDGVQIYCKAENTVNTSPKQSGRKTLNVLYRAENPVIKEGNEYRVTENNQGKLSCTVNGGNPTPTLSWNCNVLSPTVSDSSNNGVITKTFSWTAVQGYEISCSCTSRQNGFVDRSATVNVVVLYPPSRPQFKVNGNIINGDVRFIVGKTRSIQCVSDSKPSPSSYKWTGPKTNDGQNITFGAVQKSHNGQYKCEVKNTINPSTGGNTPGSSSSSVNLVVLFPPMVTDMNNISQLVGTQLEFDCPYTVGFPTETTFKWRRNVDFQTWNTRKLSIPNVTKEDAGNYQCNVSNTMKPSGDSKSYTGSDAKSLYLNVLYKASITSFTIDGFTENVVTVNENHPTHFMCNVDSKPSAVITLKNHNGILKSVTSEKLEHTIKATCSDAGTYTCSARNEHNGKDVPIRTIQLFVNCRPRSAENVNQNRTSEKGQTYTITFNAIAYPVPTFVWWKFIKGTWTKLESDNKHVIQSSDLQTNLTINKLILEDFTTYKLVTIEILFVPLFTIFTQNVISYLLLQDNVPDPPTDLRDVEALTTTSSIYITWRPGNNGGLPQTFHIKYKKGSSSTWSYIDVIDTGYKIINYSITGLAEKSQYDIVIYASNEKGNSTESNVYTVLTKEYKDSETCNIAPVIGYSVGTTSGFFILVMMSIYLVWRFRSKGAKNSDKTVSPSDAQQPNVMSTIAALYQNEGGVSNYDSLELANRDESNYSDLVTSASDQGQEKVVYENMKLV